MGFRQAGARRIVLAVTGLVMGSAMMCAMTGTAFAYTCTYAPITGGGGGDDTLTGGAGVDTISGGLGDDRAVYSPTSGTGDTFGGGNGNDTAVLDGTSGADVLTAGAGVSNIMIDRTVGAGDGALGDGENDSVGSDVETLTTGSGNDHFVEVLTRGRASPRARACQSGRAR